MAPLTNFPSDRPAAQYAHRLTPREQQVVEIIHLRNHEIATELGIRPATVKKHVERLLPKLGAENRTAAALVWQVKKAA